MSAGPPPQSRDEREPITLDLSEGADATRLPDETARTLAPEGRTPIARLMLDPRYEDLGQLGSGGFGEVRRVYDKKLDRVVAMKLLRADVKDKSPKLLRRFKNEVRITASLSHPGIITVYDDGELDDGRLWYTMPEVRGQTLRALIREVHKEERSRPFERRLIELFGRVCEAMAHAHGRGVIHRDLKPDNIMIGDLGQVIVMDWGIARRIGGAFDDDRSHGPPSSEEPSLDLLTQRGDVLGTLAYMPPEQASGEIFALGPSSDVFALGAILYHLLTGKPPFEAASPRGHRRALAGGAPALDARRVPRDLAAICARSLSPDPSDRYADAGWMATEIEAYSSGAKRRDRALEELSHTLREAPLIARLRARAAALQSEARTLLSAVKPFDPVEDKLAGWELEDEAERCRRDAALAEVRWIQGAHGALALDPDLPEAHAALADHYKDKLIEAERARRSEDAARFEELLRAHDRGRHEAFLSGNGALTLVTDPPGAAVILERYEVQRRRLTPVIVGEIGPTPIVDMPLEKGSYRLRLRAPGRIEVVYPVLIERGERWDGRPPGASEPSPIVLPRVEEANHDEVYVPAGFGWTGGDPDAPDSLPLKRVWIDGFWVARHPVTNEEYLAFLNDLVANGREDEALACCPKANRGLIEGANVELSYRRGADGLFALKERDIVEVWAPRGPVALVSFPSAIAYARWRSREAGLPYRLLHELEREKAVRGADGRLYPWGDAFDPTWACMLNSHAGDPARVTVDAYPLDESPYGMRGGAGSSHDWCANAWTQEGPKLHGDRLVIDDDLAEGEYRSVRGGAWSSVENHCRAAARFALRPDQRLSATGLRVGRSLR